MKPIKGLKMRRKKRLRCQDAGTHELRVKRSLNLTLEPLELCYRKGLIEPHHYHAGYHLRWLRSLRFGSAHIHAHDCFDLGGLYIPRITDDVFLAKMNKKYITSTKILDDINCYKIVMSVCIYMERPRFLDNCTFAKKSYELKLLRKGLDELAKLYEYDQERGENQFSTLKI
jgi:hypothetical protein